MENELIRQEEEIDGLNHHEDDKWHYWVWKCECSDTRMRPNGRAITSGCGHINVRKSQKALVASGNFQDKCRNCGRGRRLNGGNTSIFVSKDDADRYVRRLSQ